jgi:hypothetical protein
VDIVAEASGHVNGHVARVPALTTIPDSSLLRKFYHARSRNSLQAPWSTPIRRGVAKEWVAGEEVKQEVGIGYKVFGDLEYQE